MKAFQWKEIMPFDFYCVAITHSPDSTDFCISFLLFFIIFIGFVAIVLFSKKYDYMMDWFMHKFGHWF